MPPALSVRNMAQFQRALARADRDVRLGVRKEIREVARPVQLDAQALALGEIRRMPLSPQWAKMRIGITRNLVYVAPNERGRQTRRNPKRARSNLARLLRERAMEPALDRNVLLVRRQFEQMLATMASRFNRAA